MSLIATPCTLVRRTDAGTDDIYGNEQRTETLVTTTCSLQQTRREEPDAAGEASETTWSLFLPTGTAIDTGDGVVVNDAVYEVIGQPWDADEGSAAVNHVEATLRRVAGAEDIS